MSIEERVTQFNSNRELKLDPVAAKNIYLHPGIRPYQRELAINGLLHSALIAIPTGAGKTFIAAMIAINLLNWYPESKVLFLAPKKPLVDQQAEEFRSLLNIECLSVTGTQKPEQRRRLYPSHRLIFATPHVIINDIESGIFPLERLACVLVDEAHRATGSRDPSGVVVDRLPPSCRIIGLTATPGDKVQQLITRLRLSLVDHRSRADLAAFLHGSEERALVILPQGQWKVLQSVHAQLIEAIWNRIKVRVLSRSKNIFPSSLFHFWPPDLGSCAADASTHRTDAAILDQTPR